MVQILDNRDIQQTTGNNESAIMSQKATTEALGEKANNTDVFMSNLYDCNSEDNRSGGYYANGVWTAHTNYIQTHRIPCKPNECFTASHMRNSTSGKWSTSVSFWDEEGNFIVAANDYGDVHYFIVPNNSQIASFSMPIAKKHRYNQSIVKGTIIPPFGMPYDAPIPFANEIGVLATLPTENKESTVGAITEIYNTTKGFDAISVVKNVVDLSALTEGGFFSHTGEWAAMSNYLSSDFIPCKSGESYRPASRTTNLAVPVTFYTKDKTFYSGIGNSEHQNPFFTVPDDPNIAYFRMPIPKNKGNNSYLYNTSELITVNVDYNIPFILSDDFVLRSGKILSKSENHWRGKTWYAYGTSLTSTEVGKYVPYVADFSEMTVVNKGIGGGALVANRNIYNALMSTTDGKVDADLITIEVGANDASAPLGEVTSMDTNTFCGALNTCLKSILTNCPKAQVVLMSSTRSRRTVSDGTPYNLDYLSSGGYTTLERDEAIRKVAAANGVYYIPFSSLGLGLFRAQANDLYVTDNIHHTDLGGYNLAKGVWSYLKDIPLWYNELP